MIEFGRALGVEDEFPARGDHTALKHTVVYIGIGSILNENGLSPIWRAGLQQIFSTSTLNLRGNGNITKLEQRGRKIDETY